jgi:hypothetical protein
MTELSCVGCWRRFRPITGNQRYHSAECRQAAMVRARRLAADPLRSQHGIACWERLLLQLRGADIPPELRAQIVALEVKLAEAEEQRRQRRYREARLAEPEPRPAPAPACSGGDCRANSR